MVAFETAFPNRCGRPDLLPIPVVAFDYCQVPEVPRANVSCAVDIGNVPTPFLPTIRVNEYAGETGGNANVPDNLGDSKTAILTTRDGPAALFCIEATQTWLSHTSLLSPQEVGGEVVMVGEIPPRFVDTVDAEALHVISASPGVTDAWLVQSSRKEPRYVYAEISSDVIPQLRSATIAGLRRDTSHLEIPVCTIEQQEQNVEFWRKAHQTP